MRFCPCVCRRLDGGGCTAGRQRLTPLCCVRHSDWAARRERARPHAERRSAERRLFALGTKVRCKAILPAGKKGEKGEEACRAPGFASHASPTLAALRLAHEHTRAQHTRRARCTHASSPATRTCTHTATCTCTRTKASCGSSCHWPLADCRPARC